MNADQEKRGQKLLVKLDVAKQNLRDAAEDMDKASANLKAAMAVHKDCCDRLEAVTLAVTEWEREVRG